MIVLDAFPLCDGDSPLRTPPAAAQIAGSGFMTIKDHRPDLPDHRMQTLVPPPTLIVLMHKPPEIIDIHPRSHSPNAPRTRQLTAQPSFPAPDRPLLHQPVETPDTHPQHEQYRPGNSPHRNPRPLASIPDSTDSPAYRVAPVRILEKTSENGYFSFVVTLAQNSSESSSSSSHTR